ncbi:MAG: ABC transporter ATP-binding protein [Desulfurococcales archaeon ex4484_217_2]|nr:MAG: ABC transporter ATP-binding protein [Desulfurococcales archaeon ex4484_217_2]
MVKKLKTAYRVVNVSKIYGKGRLAVKALKNVTFDVLKGEFLVIMGPSGSGKTTLLNILGLLDKPTSGKVFFLGRDVSLLGDAEASKFRAKYIGFVFQQFNLIPWLTALENVEIALAIGKYPRKLRKKRAYELLEMVGLSERAHHRPRELSGGEQQRVAIARALANNPHVILADEPTGNLDSKSGAQIISILKKLSKEGKTVIVVTHNPQIAEVADRILFLRDGVLIEEKVP